MVTLEFSLCYHSLLNLDNGAVYNCVDSITL